MLPLAEPLYATLLVLVVTHTRVLLGADSCRNVLYPDGRQEQGCLDKIFRTGDCYYAVSGLSSTEDGAFSLQALIHKALLLYPDFHRALKYMATTIATELKQYLTGLKDGSPALFARLLSASHSGGEVVLVTRVDEIPTAALLTYTVANSSPVRVVLQSWSIDTTNIGSGEDCFWRAIGNTDFLKASLPTVPEMSRQPVERIRVLLQQGARAHPEQIGPPFSILELSAAGERWIEKSATTPNHV